MHDVSFVNLFEDVEMKVFVRLFCLCIGVYYPLSTTAEPVPLEQNQGLKRFDKSAILSHTSNFDIRAIRVGDNILAKTIELQEQGGTVRYIS